MTDHTKWSLLGGLVLVWLALFALRVINQPEPQRIPLTYVSGQTLAREAARGAGGLPTLIRPQARASQAAFREPKNIFARLTSAPDRDSNTRLVKKPAASVTVARPGPFQGPPMPSPEELAAEQALRQQEQVLRQQELTAQQARQQKELAAQQSRQLLAKYRFLGYLSQGGEPRAFLGKGNELYIVRTGETVEGRIQVKGIDATSVKLLDATTSLETTLPLTKESGVVF